MTTSTQPKGDPLTRAFSAYFSTEGSFAAQPSTGTTGSAVETIDGKDYVVLRNSGGVLAVYRIRTSGVLKRLTRWPKQLEEA